MRREKPIPALSPDWQEGHFFDLWMLVHVMSGVAGGFSSVFFGLTAAWTLWIALGVMLLWEVGEYALGVRESWINRALDVVVGLGGVAAALWIGADWTSGSRTWAFWGSFATATVLGVLGGIASRRRAASPPVPPG